MLCTRAAVASMHVILDHSPSFSLAHSPRAPFQTYRSAHLSPSSPSFFSSKSFNLLELSLVIRAFASFSPRAVLVVFAYSYRSSLEFELPQSLVDFTDSSSLARSRLRTRQSLRQL